MTKKKTNTASLLAVSHRRGMVTTVDHLNPMAEAIRFLRQSVTLQLWSEAPEDPTSRAASARCQPTSPPRP